jgi:serine/threonine protein kinase
MGVVYEAEQDHPRRTVALKVISPGLVSLEHAKRFGDEAQILALLQHPGIAQVYDAGIVEDGRPFFAMESTSMPAITVSMPPRGSNSWPGFATPCNTPMTGA